MRSWRIVGTLLVAVSAAWPADQPSPAALTNCANGVPNAPACVVSPQTQQEARKAFERGMKLQKQKRLDEALEEFEKAGNLVPKDVQYATLRELVRQQLVYEHLQRGNAALATGQQIEALGEFRNVLHLDPTNDFARQRLSDAVDHSGAGARQSPRVIEQSDEIRVVPRDDIQSFHFRGDSRQLLTQVAAAFGIVVTFDDSVVSRRVRFDVDEVGFYAAMQLAGAVTKTFWSPLQEKQILVATESTENHRLYDRMGLRTFYVPDAATPQELQDLSNVLRTVFEVKYVSSNAQKSTLTVRAPQNVLNPASQFLEGLGSAHPEVMLDVRIYEISRTVIHNFGLQIPNQFNLYNIPIGALGLTLAGGKSIQDLINELIASGGINQGNSSALAALLAQLGGGSNSIFSQPLATFGGGQTLFGVSLGTLGATFSRNESQLRSLQHVTLRAAQGKDATVNLGSRYPIVNASFAPIFNTAAISQAIGNNSYIAPVPSFTYEDLGVTLKVKPAVHGDSDVSMNIELKVRSLTGASANGVPVIGNREYTGSINVKNDQAAVVAGQITSTEQRSLNGIPGLGQLPVLSRAVASNSNEKDEDEMLVVVTPHIIRMAETTSSEIWMSGVK
ncbi:MAG: type II and III secretion system protein [Terriglobales bacterium]